MLESLLRMFKKSNVNDAVSAYEDQPPISAETEVKLIKHYLEEKFGHEFKARVKVDGYIEEPEYRLVLNDYDATKGTDKSHSVWGDTVRDVLGLNFGFVNAYWRNVERGMNAAKSDVKLDRFDAERMADYRDTAVAGSRNEMILRAAAEGLI